MCYDNNKSYWEYRAKSKGHTGWADPVVYSYDQKIRLSTIDKIIRMIGKKERESIALDYGCGSGDFSVLLSKYFSKVKATDLSDNVLNIAKKNNNKDNVEYLNLDYKLIFNSKYDMILSITVLQHILDDVDLLDLLKRFSKSLSNDGIVVVLESFSENKNEKFINQYINMRDKKNFLELARLSGLTLKYSYNFYNPYKSKVNFNNVFFLILRKMITLKVPLAKIILEFCMGILAKNESGIVDYENNTKILVFSRK